MNEINPTAVPIRLGHQRKLDFKKLQKLVSQLLAAEHNEKFVTKYKKT